MDFNLRTSQGTPFRSPTTTTNLASNTTVNHSYQATTGTAYIKQISASASGLIKAELFTSPDLVSFTSIGFVKFKSQTATEVIIIPETELSIAVGTYIVVRILNRELTAQDVYSTIEGYQS